MILHISRQLTPQRSIFFQLEKIPRFHIHYHRPFVSHLHTQERSDQEVTTTTFLSKIRFQNGRNIKCMVLRRGEKKWGVLVDYFLNTTGIWGFHIITKKKSLEVQPKHNCVAFSFSTQLFETQRQGPFLPSLTPTSPSFYSPKHPPKNKRKRKRNKKDGYYPSS